MRTRIRTIKPDFFQHSAVFDLEQATGLPIRTAFIGLLTCADREGRFRWRPRELKLHVLPYDDVAFERVLDALVTRGFVVKYAVAGEEFGCFPTWHKHQVINGKESASALPAAGQEALNFQSEQQLDATVTRASRVNDATVTQSQDQPHGNGNGNGNLINLRSEKKMSPDDSHSKKASISELLRAAEEIYSIYPRHTAKKAALKAIQKAITEIRQKDGGSVDDASAFLIAAVQKYANSPAGQNGQYTPHCATWMNRAQYFDDPAEWCHAQSGSGNFPKAPVADVTKNNPATRNEAQKKEALA